MARAVGSSPPCSCASLRRMLAAETTMPARTERAVTVAKSSAALALLPLESSSSTWCTRQLERLLVARGHGAREGARRDGGHHLDRGDERRARVAGTHVEGDRARELHGPLVHAVQVVAYARREVLTNRDLAQVVDVEPSARVGRREERALVNHRLREEQKVLGHRVRIGHGSLLLGFFLCSSPLLAMAHGASNEWRRPRQGHY
eukprot:scaffold94526_cov63-Phaeocystis_antarctica.AAC.2